MENTLRSKDSAEGLTLRQFVNAQPSTQDAEFAAPFTPVVRTSDGLRTMRKNKYTPRMRKGFQRLDRFTSPTKSMMSEFDQQLIESARTAAPRETNEAWESSVDNECSHLDLTNDSMEASLAPGTDVFLNQFVIEAFRGSLQVSKHKTWLHRSDFRRKIFLDSHWTGKS